MSEVTTDIDEEGDVTVADVEALARHMCRKTYRISRHCLLSERAYVAAKWRAYLDEAWELVGGNPAA